jgi:hypothetical protein
MKRLHLTNGIIERSLPYEQKFGDYKENDMASYIFAKNPDGSITALKNRFGTSRGEITKAEHTATLHRTHVGNIIPFGVWDFETLNFEKWEIDT